MSYSGFEDAYSQEYYRYGEKPEKTLVEFASLKTPQLLDCLNKRIREENFKLIQLEEKYQELLCSSRNYSFNISKLKENLSIQTKRLAEISGQLDEEKKKQKPLQFISKRLKELLVLEKETCPVCYEEFSEIELLSLCGHAVCTTCFLKLSEHELTCPICREDLY